MKRIILFCFAFYLNLFAHAQKQDLNGVWLNSNVVTYYDSNSYHACDIRYFNDNKFVPLFLAFENQNQLKVTLRYEQRIFTYNVKRTSIDSFTISDENNSYKIYLADNILKLNYKNNNVVFRKVSDKYSSDTFGEYIKDYIFYKNKRYCVNYFYGVVWKKKFEITKDNIKQKIKELFGCERVDFVQLGSFKYANSCLPEIALYYKDNFKKANPEVFGILVSSLDVKFVDQSSKTILILKRS